MHARNILLACIAAVIIGIASFYVARRFLESREARQQALLRCMAVSTISAFNDSGVQYWLDFGTLLGVIREGDIILGDNDVDICIRDDDDTRARMEGPVRTRLQAQGYELKRLTWSAYRVRAHGLFVDVYITKTSGDTIIGATGPNSNVASALVGTPKWVQWPRCAIRVLVPEHVHDVLVWRYGEDYMTPKRNFKGRDA